MGQISCVVGKLLCTRLYPSAIELFQYLFVDRTDCVVSPCFVYF